MINSYFKIGFMKLLKVRIIFFFLYSSFLLAANDFTPIVTQFNKKDYNAGNQNWSVAQDSQGLIYFGNNVGLLRFDGSGFTLFKLPNNQVVRSVYIDKSDRIYVGSFREFGYFEKDKFGELVYSSLSNDLKNYKLENDEIWKIIEFDGKILFQSFKSIFIYDGKNVEGKSYDETFLYLQRFRNKLYVHTLQNGLSSFDPKNKKFTKIENTPFSSAVISIIQFNKNEAYVITLSDGIYIFDGQDFRKFSDGSLDYLRNAEINKATLTRDSLLVIGTILDGVSAIDKNGKKVWKLNTSNNLQNNTVLGMSTDSENNLWLALDKGIAMVRLNSPVQFVQSFTPSIGSIYSLSYLPPDKLYLATNQGLYSGRFSPDSKSLTNIQLDSQIKGQVWSLTNVDNQLFCGNNEETYRIYPDRKMLSTSKGGMCIGRGIIHGREVLVEGTYSDLCVYLKENNEWKFHSVIQGFLNPVKSITIDYQGRIWASHMHEGLYMIMLKSDLKTIDKIQKFTSLDNKKSSLIYTYMFQNRVVFTDNTRFYVFDDIKNKILPFDELNTTLGKYARAYKICIQKPSTYWFILEKEAALIQFIDNRAQILDIVQYSLFMNQTVDNFQNIIPLTEDIAMFTLENGLAMYNLKLRKQSLYHSKKEILLMQVQVVDKNSEEMMLLPVSSANEKISFPYTKNRIRFTIGYPQYSNLNDLLFSYKLTGLNNNWSESTTSNMKEYSYLRPGKYTFSVRVVSNNGDVFATRDYSFRVRSPFYWNTFSKIIYVLLLILTGFIIYNLLKRNFEQKKQRIQQEQENIRKKEIEKREMQIVALKAEKLESDLTLKSKELAMSTITVIRKNEVLINIKDELIELKKHLGTQFPNKYYERIIKLMDQSISSDDDWKIFQTNFDRIHENFFRNLRTKYPELTPNDLRFCAYFRLNLSTKDVAHLMNISAKGVEVARYRIRKKINIPSEKNISEFLIEFR